ncbi:MAG: hypothetical protein CMO82_11280 [Winogradskyella sp.]|nr:hypothetical protein [Winogradskyella sp.]|tara:strand:+ start:58 stop:453 length:396 start_codon:yes stop_codon:yes gene_type:complete
MDLLNKRDTTQDNDVLEKRFIGHILKEEAEELDNYQQSLMSSRGFTTSSLYNNRGFQVLEDHKLQYTHPQVLRFIDMKTRSSKSGQTTKKIAHPVHNKPIYGMINNVLRRLQFEYTDKMKKMLLNDYNLHI